MRIKWTKEKCHYEALKYNTRIDFMKNNKNAYGASQKHGWLDDVCSHMIKIGNRLFRCIYVYEFSDNSVYVGLTYNLQKRDISRKKQNDDAVTKYINETKIIPILRQLSDYIPINDASLLEKEFIKKYLKNN